MKRQGKDGGFMLIGVPAFRLPREAIEMDVRLVERLGVRFIYNTTIGVDIMFDQLQRDFDAIAITAGAMNAIGLDVPGADLDGVQYGVDFMKRANLGEPLEVGHNVVVIGGGYTAMDCSRTSLRHGAEHVSIVYRRTRSELVVDEEELGETEREGVRMEFLVSPVELVGEDGRLTGVRFIRNRLGEPDASGRRSPVPIEGSAFVVPASRPSTSAFAPSIGCRSLARTTRSRSPQPRVRESSHVKRRRPPSELWTTNARPSPKAGTRPGTAFASAEEAGQWFIREKLISTVPWDEAGAHLRPGRSGLPWRGGSPGPV